MLVEIGEDGMTAEADILERTDAAFVEALAEAPNIREYETGAHSKRVACHTLLLARRFTADTDPLRQIHTAGVKCMQIGEIRT